MCNLYLQDVFVHSNSLGLYALMQGDWVFDTIVRCLCALPLLPNYLLFQGLIEIGNWARNTGFMRWPRVRDLFAYIEHEWMRRYRYLSVCGSEDRTNNISECANATLGWDLRQNRPNVYDMISKFIFDLQTFDNIFYWYKEELEKHARTSQAIINYLKLRLKCLQNLLFFI